MPPPFLTFLNPSKIERVTAFNNNNNSSFICLVIRCKEQGHNKLASNVFQSLFHYPYNSLATMLKCMYSMYAVCTYFGLSVAWFKSLVR